MIVSIKITIITFSVQIKKKMSFFDVNSIQWIVERIVEIVYDYDKVITHEVLKLIGLKKIREMARGLIIILREIN